MRQIKSVSTSMVFDVPTGPAVRWKANVDGSLTGCRGRIWLTREGDRNDYWVEPGMSVAVQAGDVLWVANEAVGDSETETEGRLTFQFSTLASVSTGGMRAWAASLLHGRQAGRHLGA